MEKLSEPVLFDDSGRHVDMTEIIENLFIGTQWVHSIGLTICRWKISKESFYQGGSEEHILPEEGDLHVVNQESDHVEPGGGDPCAQHC